MNYQRQKIWADKEARTFRLGREIPNTPKVPELFVHLASGYSLTHHHPPPPPPLPSRSQLKVSHWRRFNNSHLAPICAPSRLCQSLQAWHGVLFLGQHFSPIVCSDDSLMKPWPSCAPFEVTSERCAALIRKPWDANTLHSRIPVAALARGRRVRPQAADKQLSVHSHSHGQMYSVNACLYVTVCAVTLVKEDILSLLSEERNYLASFFFKSFLPVWPTAKIISCFLCKLANFKGHSGNRQHFGGTSTWNCCLLT